VKVRVTGLTGTVDRAALRLWVTNSSRAGPVVAPASTHWSGRTITWANQPAATGSALGTTGDVPAGAWVEIDVTSRIRADGTYAFVLRPISADGLVASSMQGAHPPRLVVETLPAS
jgi:hypothetical protein